MHYYYCSCQQQDCVFDNNIKQWRPFKNSSHRKNKLLFAFIRNKWLICLTNVKNYFYCPEEYSLPLEIGYLKSATYESWLVEPSVAVLTSQAADHQSSASHHTSQNIKFDKSDGSGEERLRYNFRHATREVRQNSRLHQVTHSAKGPRIFC